MEFHEVIAQLIIIGFFCLIIILIISMLGIFLYKVTNTYKITKRIKKERNKKNE